MKSDEKAETLETRSLSSDKLPRVTQNAEGREETNSDPLTGLFNRRSLILELQDLIDGRSCNSGEAALILLDLDRFKLINDSLGPIICDHLLCKIAQRIKTVAPEAEMVARVSGDGFAVLLRDSANACMVASKLIEFLGRPFAVSGHAITLGASAGVATANEHGVGALDLLHAADLAMHQAQTEGRNRVRRFEPFMPKAALIRHSLETDLRSAIALQQVELRRALVSQQFEVHYQPQVTLAERRLTGFEALLRWRHPERGVVPPDKFIPMAEEIGLIDLLGEWVLRTACRDAMTWSVSPGVERPSVSVNVSPFQLRDSVSLLSGVRRALDESGLPPGKLELELTESAMGGEIAPTLKAIREMGIQLALDDFGTGYSSLGRLRHLPFTRLKIDRSFVVDLGKSTGGSNGNSGEWMIRAIASLGIGLGLNTVVEGIETLEQEHIARQSGCCEMQGYLISRPLPASAINNFISTINSNQNEKESR